MLDQLNDFLFDEDKQKHLGSLLPAAPLPQDKKWKILIVDDEADVHDVTRMTLRRLRFDGRGLEFISAYSATEAKAILQASPDIAVMLLDVVMEQEDAGLTVVHYVRKELSNSMVRIILRTGHPGQAPEENVTIDYDINDYREKTELTTQRLLTAVITALRSYRDLSLIDDLNQEIEATQKELLFTLGEIAESRSTETGNHVKRVAAIARLLAEKHGLPSYEVELLELAAAMHDLGKLAIHDSILNKPGPLTAEEFAVMKTHAQLGYDMLKASKRPLLQAAALIAREHHENYDGSGYPRGLKGEEIHIYSRIVALSDVFDALGTKRVYKDSWDSQDIFAFVTAQRGKKFDPALVDLLLLHREEILSIRQRLPSNPAK